MPRIKKGEVVASDKKKIMLEKDESIQVKRIHRKTPKKIETVKEVEVPIGSLLPVEEIKAVEVGSLEEPRIEEVENEEVSNEVAQAIKREFLGLDEDTKEQPKEKIQKLEKEIKPIIEKEANTCDCNCCSLEKTDESEPTVFMQHSLRNILFVFCSSVMIGLNILILVFFAYLIALMFH